MAYQLLEIVDGDLTVCYEYGHHDLVRTTAASWLTIRKRDGVVSLSLGNLRSIIEQDCDALAEHGMVLSMDYDYGRVHVEANGPGMFRGELAIANAAPAFYTPPAEPGRHRVVLSLPEQRSLADMEVPLRAFAKVFSIGGLRIGDRDGSVQRKHALQWMQSFRFIGPLHVCEFQLGGALVLEPFRSVAVECDCGAHTAEAEAWADKARLRLNRVEADDLLEFNESELAGVAVPREGRVHRLLRVERAVGVWPSQTDFPNDTHHDGDRDCTLVPFTQLDWRWFTACLRLYLAAGEYLLRRERAAKQQAKPPRPASLPISDRGQAALRRARAAAEQRQQQEQQEQQQQQQQQQDGPGPLLQTGATPETDV